jgi:Ni/Fe-hydrogenase subunit HybB-like protein
MSAQVQSANTGGGTSMVSMLLLPLAIIGLLIGAYGMRDMFTVGHSVLNTGTEMMWGLPVVTYAYLALTSFGVAIVATVGAMFAIPGFGPIYRRCLTLALGLSVGGLLALFLELGHPFRALYAIPLNFQFRSPLYWMGFFWLLFIVPLVLMLLKLRTTPADSSASRPLEIVLLIAALGALSTQGLVYGMMGMRPFWFGATLPLYFLAGALVVGLALVILLTNLAHDLNRDKMPEPTRQLMGSTLPNVLLVVLALYILTTIGRVVTGLWSSLDGHQVVYVNMMNSHLFHLEFFGGLLLPFVLLALPGLRTNPLVQVLASLLLVIALFIGRYEFTIGGQLVPLFKGNWIPGLIQYTPSTVEWMLTLTTVSVALLVYAIAEKLFNPPRV